MTQSPGALYLWRRELRQGLRAPTHFDWLWRAACLEAEALDFRRDRLPILADEREQVAATLMEIAREAVRQRAA